MSAAKDLTKQRFGRGIVLYATKGRAADGSIIHAVLCDCGILYPVSSTNLCSGHTKSCGCLQREMVTTHGMWYTRFYSIWHGMKDRCCRPKGDPKHAYYHRGITICKRWKNFKNFRDDMRESYIELQKKNCQPSIERVDVNGNYCPENCCWIPVELQNKNKRNTKKRKTDQVQLVLNLDLRKETE